MKKQEIRITNSPTINIHDITSNNATFRNIIIYLTDCNLTHSAKIKNTF